MINLIDINEITPAEYNPRTINEEEFNNLKSSLNELGIILPVIVNKANKVIIAGHQRTNAIKSLGIKQVPVVLVEDITLGDEMKLNQLHNAIDREPNQAPKLKSNINDGVFTKISWKEFDVFDSHPVYVREICNLLVKYGNLLSCIVCDGKVLLGGNYVKACKLLGFKVNTYQVPKEKYTTVTKYLSMGYGKYSYGKIEKNTYVQGLAQLHRNPTRTDGKKAFKSHLYENFVIPYLDENSLDIVLDFACGKGSYVELLKDKFDILGIEFFNNNGHEIEVDKGHKMIDSLVSKIENVNEFDVVVLDSVVNSVDSHEAEEHILNCMNRFVKLDGTLFISGRSLEQMKKDVLAKTDITTGKRFIEFIDDRGLTSNFRKGNWYFQKYHSKDEIKNNLEKAGFKIIEQKWNRCFYIVAKKIEELSEDIYVKSLSYEFNLPLPNGNTYERQEDILMVYNY